MLFTHPQWRRRVSVLERVVQRRSEGARPRVAEVHEFTDGLEGGVRTFDHLLREGAVRGVRDLAWVGQKEVLVVYLIAHKKLEKGFGSFGNLKYLTN